MQTIREASDALRARKVSCVELVQEALRAEEQHRDLNCFITLTADAALEEAEQLDAELADGRSRGPLHGIPIAHKDLYHTAGVRTTNGSRIFADFVPDRDAVSVHMLREAGTISLGKLNMHEMAYGITSNNPHYGPVRNPYGRDHIPGGSSGGSGAAVAAGIVFGATGSDTGGSIRIPASFCGVVGFKATFGAVSTEGCFPLGDTLDHMGPLARTVEDAALLLEAMSGKRYPVEPNARIHVGIPENFFLEQVQSDVAKAVEAAAQRAEALGATVRTVRTPDPDGLFSVARVILLCEAAAALREHIERKQDFGPDVLTLLETGSKLLATDYVLAMRDRTRLRTLWSELFQEIDVLLAPATPTTAPKIGQSTVQLNGVEHDTRLLTTRCCRGINLLGYPAISIPWGLAADGFPIGVQVIGGPHQDTRVLNFASALETARNSG